MDDGISVLLVDDEPGIVELGRIFLERGGSMHVDTATSVDEAVSLLRSRDYDVVVSDYDMPGLTGIDLMRSLRGMDKDTPIIIFTGKGNEEIAIDALNSGVSMYLRKGEEPRSQFLTLRQKVVEIARAKWIEKLLKDKGHLLKRQLYPFSSAPEDVRSDEENLIATWNKQGFQFASEGRNVDAMKVLDGILHIDPGNIPAIINKGVCLGRLGKIPDEIRQYQSALSIDPDIPVAWFNKGIALYEEGNISSAKSSFAQVFRIEPKLAVLLKEPGESKTGSRTIMVTGVGGASGQVLAKFFRNHTTHRIIGVDANANAPGQIFCHEFHTVPYASDPSFIGVIRDFSKEHSVNALFCTVDEELALVAAHRDDFKCHVLLSDPDAISACLDKAVCMATLTEANIPCAKTILLDGAEFDEIVAELGSPFIVKPRIGRGSRGVQIIRDQREYEIACRVNQFGTGLIAQEYLSGTEYTIDVLLDAKGKYAVSVPRERILTDSGVSTVGRTIGDSALEQLARTASETMRLRYIINVQARRDSHGDPKIIEINPRPSGTLSLSIASSVGMPTIALDFSDGIDVESIAPIIYVPGVTMFRYWEENFQ